MASDDTMNAPDLAGTWRGEFEAYAKATAGACLFGLPLLFTMEMWWIGEYLERPRLGGFVLLGLTLNIALSYFAGFRDENHHLRDAVLEGVEAVAIGTLVALVALFALNRIGVGDSLDGVLGMLAIQAIPLSLGASVANLVFSGDGGRGLEDDDDAHQGGSGAELLNDVLATFAGAIFLGFAMAPTDEIPMLASGMEGWHVLALIVVTLAASYLIVFASGFDPDQRSRSGGGYFQDPFSETVLAYVVALAASKFLLLGFGHITPSQPLLATLTEVVVLAVPASIGGAAGRVVV